MRTPSIPESGPKRRLLDAAEQLFADKGFDSVSVRDITKMAGANVAAVNYHFGSREGLLTMVVTRYLTPVNEERLAMLDAAEKKAGGKPVPVEEIIVAMARPLLNQVTKSQMSEKVFCKLLGRVLSEQSPLLGSAVEEQMRPMARRFNAALVKTFPEVPREEILWRFHFVVGSILHTLTHQEMFKNLAEAEDLGMQETFEKFVSFAVAGMLQKEASAALSDETRPATPQASFNF